MSSMASSLFQVDTCTSPVAPEQATALATWRSVISAAACQEEQAAVQHLLAIAAPSSASDPRILELATKLVDAVRAQRQHGRGVDALMQGFPLSSSEGLALMGLAEALLRVPDRYTADLLIADKIGQGDWHRHAAHAGSPWVKAAAYSLSLASRFLNREQASGFTAVTAPVVRRTANMAMRQLGEQFVCGQSIDEALQNSSNRERQGYRYSYDMLGETALTTEDALRYYASYETALHAIGRRAKDKGIHDSPGISVKLSALHPRYSYLQRERVMQELLPRLKQLLILAKHYGVGLNIDAEEAERLELSLDLVEALAFDPDLADFDGMGIVVQAYQKRCLPLIDYLVELARRSKRRFMVRLVKGAYWDTEIKRAQVEGLATYPVFTRKAYTDVSYLVCAQKLLVASEWIYPQFATHNAHTVATIFQWAREQGVDHYEFQCLYGMGESLYDQVVGKDKLNKPCRIYAPVGPYSSLLAYLVRRLLENGANSSFVNQLLDKHIPLDSLLADPFTLARQWDGEPHPAIPLPANLFGETRRNSSGIDFSSHKALHILGKEVKPFERHQWHAAPLIQGTASKDEPKEIGNPADSCDRVGLVVEANENDVECALAAAHAYAPTWQAITVAQRTHYLRTAADLFETHRSELMMLLVREAGKTWSNVLAEVREAVDFLRYYALQAEALPAVTPLGPVVCISPWNFPLAIFTGELSAALAVGNVVLAKPAEQTPLIAYRAIELLHEAGIPSAALQLLPGSGEVVGDKLVRDARVKGVVFTGSTEVAQHIHRVLTQRSVQEQCDIPLIAETGGQNALIVDASALTEQVVRDVLTSAFDSTGQRCSALRVLCLQEEIADTTLTMLKGALQELRIGDPKYLATDVGPVIDQPARQALVSHIARMRAQKRPVFQCSLNEAPQQGHFILPTIIEVASLSELTREVFGPVLHVIRYRKNELPRLIDQINATEYGLTLGIHSRIDRIINFIADRAKVGNIYVNRNMVGAVVGVQPFGGERKSGTGPKAGGPLYLLRLVREPLQLAQDEVHYQESQKPSSPSALSALIDWCSAKGHQKLVETGESYRASTLLNKEIRLPGPTGERNLLRFRPRGGVLCIAGSEPHLLHQLMGVLASGNRALVLSSSAQFIARDLPEVVCRQIAILPDKADLAFDAVLIDTASLPNWLSRLPLPDEVIVPVVRSDDSNPIPLWRLMVERAICINTMAAGGNASLATLGK